MEALPNLQAELAQLQAELYKLEKVGDEEAAKILNARKQIINNLKHQINIITQHINQLQPPNSNQQPSIPILQMQIQLLNLTIACKEEIAVASHHTVAESISQEIVLIRQQLSSKEAELQALNNAAKNNAVDTGNDAEQKRADDEVKNGDDGDEKAQSVDNKEEESLISIIRECTTQMEALQAEESITPQVKIQIYQLDWKIIQANLSLIELKLKNIFDANERNQLRKQQESYLEQQKLLKSQQMKVLDDIQNNPMLKYNQQDIDAMIQSFHNMLNQIHSITDIALLFRNTHQTILKLDKVENKDYFKEIPNKLQQEIDEFNKKFKEEKKKEQIEEKQEKKKQKQKQKENNEIPDKYTINKYLENDIVQPTFTKHIIPILNKHSTHLTAIDAHINPTIRNLKPDIIISNSKSLDCFSITIVGELKSYRDNGIFVDSDVHQVLEYGLELAQLQLFRFNTSSDTNTETAFIYLFLSDIQHFIFYKMTFIRRYNSLTRMHKVVVDSVETSVVLDCVNGLSYLSYLMNLPTHQLGYEIPTFKTTLQTYNIDKIVGSGASGIVYGCSNAPVAVKHFKNPEEAERELKMLQYLNSQGVTNVCRVSDSSSNLIVMSPMGTPFIHKTNDIIQAYQSKKSIITIQLHHIIKLIDILEQIHNLKVIHRDIKEDNLILSNDTVFLVDFGCAVFDDGLECHHQGSIIYSTDDVLLMMANAEKSVKYVPHKHQDLFAVVIIWLCYMDNIIYDIMKLMCNDYMQLIQYRHQIIKKFRAELVVKYALNGDYGNLKQEMMKISGNM